MGRQSWYQCTIFVILSCCIAAFAIRRGMEFAGQRATDPVSEEQAVSDARQIFAGNHKWGIVQYTHYPNGPSYLLLPAIKYGFVEKEDLRIVPVVFSGLSLGVFCFGLLVSARSWLATPLIMGLVISLLYQPGVVNWMSALHEQSYALAICFAAMGISLMAATGWKTLFCVSFIAGWIGYDFTFCLLFSVLACRWLSHLRSGGPVRMIARGSIVDGFAAALGIGVAVATHVAQNAMALGGIRIAMNDLFGSAAARAGLAVAKELNSEYAGIIQAAHGGIPYPRVDLIRDLLKSFLAPDWIDVAVLRGLLLGLGTALALVLLFRACQAFLARSSPRIVLTRVVLYVAPLIFLPLAGVTWFVLMPDHARFHFHFIQRHFFVPIALFGVWMLEIVGRSLSRVGAKVA